MRTYTPERDIADLLFVLWSKRFLIVGVVVAAALGTLALSSAMPKTYRATATLIITDAKMPSNAGEPRPDARLYSDTYAALIKSESISTKVVNALNLERQGAFTSASLADAIRVRPVPNTLLVTVSLDDVDPERAAAIVNAQSSSVAELSRAMSTSNLTDTREYLQAQVAASQRELEDREVRLQKVKSEVRFEESTKRLASLLELRGTLEENLSEAEQDAAKGGAAATAIRGALEGQERVLTLNRTIVDDPALGAVVGGDGSRTPREALSLKLQAQQVNPLHERAEPALVEATAAAAGAASRANTVRRQLQSNEAEVRRLERVLADKGTVLSAAQREYDLAKTAYESFSKSFESARLSVRAQVAEIKLISPAVPDRNPVGPPIALNVLAALFSSAILVVLSVLGADYLRTARADVASVAPDAVGTPR